MHDQVTVALIMDCPAITIHAGKCHKALIDSRAATFIIKYSIYQLIDDSFKTPIQPITTNLNTADRTPVIALGMTALSLRTADFKFTSNFIISDRLPDTDIIFGINVQKKFSLSCTWDKEKNCYIQKNGRFLTYTRKFEIKATMGIVKSMFRIPPRHVDIIPIKIKRSHNHGTYCILHQQSRLYKRKGSHINIVNVIHNIKGKTSVNILVSNYTNKHITFSKREYVGHLEPTIEDIEEEKILHSEVNSDAHTTNSITTQ